MKYFAFISYSKEDEVWAKWLHKSIEKYRIPSRLKLNFKRLFPVFIDREELPTSPSIVNEIKLALKNSSYLIVICSPNSARSIWVNEEILEFIRLDRRDRILCVIVKGEPNSSNKNIGTLKSNNEECFPNALMPEQEIKTIQPLAADLRPGKDGKRKALLKVISGITNISFYELYRRDKIRHLQRVLITLIIIISIIFSSIFYWFSFIKISESYYSSSKKEWGEYVGFNSMDKNDIKYHDELYRFIRKGWIGKLDSVEIINYTGKPNFSMNSVLGTYLPKTYNTNFEHIVRIEYIRNSSGNVMEERGFNKDIKRVYTLRYLDPNKHSSDRVRAVFFSNYGADKRTSSNAVVVEFLRYISGNESGLDYEINYFDIYGKLPKPDEQGIYGQKIKYNNQKLPKRITFIDQRGMKKKSKGSNFTTLIISYNKEGKKISIIMLDETLEEKTKEDNNKILFHYDINGNMKEMISILKVNNNIVNSKSIIKKGVMRESVTTIFNSSEKIISVSRTFFDEEMRLGVSDEGISMISFNSNGVQIYTNTSLSESPEFELIPHILIDKVIPGGIAEKVGLQVGDIILKYGGKITHNAKILEQLTREYDNNITEVELIIVRKINILNFHVPKGDMGVEVSENF